MTLKEVHQELSNELGMPKGTIQKVYNTYWKYIKNYIQQLPLKLDITEEEFSKLRPNINIPNLGKLNVTYERHKNVRKKFSIINEILYAKHKED